jgi:hypothetical protein
LQLLPLPPQSPSLSIQPPLPQLNGLFPDRKAPVSRTDFQLPIRMLSLLLSLPLLYHLAQHLLSSLKPQLLMLHHYTGECLDRHKQCMGISPQRP